VIIHTSLYFTANVENSKTNTSQLYYLASPNTKIRETGAPSYII